MSVVECIENELDRLAERHESPEAFEALSWVLYQSKVPDLSRVPLDVLPAPVRRKVVR